MRSMTCRCFVVTPKAKLVSRRKSFVSITSVSPSQLAVDDPVHCASPGVSRPSSGTTRKLWFISFSRTTSSGVWKICTFWL